MDDDDDDDDDDGDASFQAHRTPWTSWTLPV